MESDGRMGELPVGVARGGVRDLGWPGLLLSGNAGTAHFIEEDTSPSAPKKVFLTPFPGLALTVRGGKVASHGDHVC